MTDVRRIVSENRRVIWILAAALVLNAAMYALVVAPLSERVETEQQQAGQATQDLNAAQRALTAAQATVTGKRQAEEELQRFYADVLPSSQSAARRVLHPYLPQLAAKAKLRTLSQRTSPDTYNRGELRKLTATMMLSGEYPNIRRFIHVLETAPEFLVLESVVVTQAPESSGLNVTAHLATYYRTAVDGN